MKRISPSIREAVRQRADGRCEYCRLPEKITPFSHQVDHIIPHDTAAQTKWIIWHGHVSGVTITRTLILRPMNTAKRIETRRDLIEVGLWQE